MIPRGGALVAVTGIIVLPFSGLATKWKTAPRQVLVRIHVEVIGDTVLDHLQNIAGQRSNTAVWIEYNRRKRDRVA